MTDQTQEPIAAQEPGQRGVPRDGAQELPRAQRYLVARGAPWRAHALAGPTAA